MDTLKELIQIVEINKVRKIEILDKSSKNKSKVYMLFKGIANGEFSTDEEASAFFFNDSPNNQQYRNLKTQLRKKLYNTIFFIDPVANEKDHYRKLTDSILIKLNTLRILYRSGAYKTVIPMYKSLLKQTVRAEVTEVNIEIIKALRYYYGTHDFNEKLFKKYDSLLNHFMHLQEKEIVAEGMYLQLTQLHMKHKGQKQELSKLYDVFSKQLTGLFTPTSTTRLLFYSGIIEVGKYMDSYQYRKAINVCEKILALLEAKPIQKEQILVGCQFQKLVCHTQLREFEEGTLCMNKLNTYIEEGTFNWFKGKELNMFLLLHTKKYNDAYRVFNEVYNHRKYKKLTKPIQETWEIFRAYLHYLIFLELIEPIEKDTNFKNFRINRFLNTVPTYSKDKRGFNIAILVIQIIFSILQHKHDLVFDRMEAIEKYSTRYLKKDANFRSNCFIKILMEIPKASFHRIGVERRAKKYVKRLSEVPLEIANQLHSIEVIPYEDLWPLVLKTLSLKRLDKK